MPRRSARVAAASEISEKDVRGALDAVGLRVHKEVQGWRGCEGTIEGRYVWWPVVTTVPIRCLHLGGFCADTKLTRPVENGRVQWELEFRGAPRAVALDALREAVRLLVERD